ncbi:AbrB/MazE/SpoVT family DNA-binding domain-containing protein [Nanoarchaeota archaeon]
MEYRKIISFGNSSFVISLPKPWLEKHGLKKGDTLYLQVNNRDIVLHPREGTPEKSEIHTEIDAKDMDMEILERKLVASYINNADKITVRTKEMTKKAKDIKNVIQSLVAMEVVEQTTNSIVVKSFLNIKDVDIVNIMRKTDHIIATMFNALVEVAESNGKQSLEISESINQRDDDVNKLCFLIFRAINHKLRHGTPDDTSSQMLQYWGMAFFLEETADELKRIGRLLAKCKSPMCEGDYVSILQETKENYKNAMKAFYTDNKELTYDVAKRRNPLLAKCDTLLENNMKDPLMVALMDNSKDMVAKIHNINRMSY